MVSGMINPCVYVIVTDDVQDTEDKTYTTVFDNTVVSNTQFKLKYISDFDMDQYVGLRGGFYTKNKDRSLRFSNFDHVQYMCARVTNLSGFFHWVHKLKDEEVVKW